MTTTPTSVRLSPITEPMLARLVQLATTDADADEVTPPLTDDGQWSASRIAWFKDYHRTRRTGLDGDFHEATWAVVRGDEPIGSVRLQRSEPAGVLEAGIWLARTARGSGAAKQALQALVDEARRQSARSIVANTTAPHAKAIAILGSAGFSISEPSPDGQVRAQLQLSP